MRVLLVEDDVDMLDVTTYALRKYGYEVVGVTDGAAALQRWEKDQPDLVLLDLNLPHVSGMDVCREIRKRSSTRPPRTTRFLWWCDSSGGSRLLSSRPP